MNRKLPRVMFSDETIYTNAIVFKTKDRNFNSPENSWESQQKLTRSEIYNSKLTRRECTVKGGK